jgi:hypothetical protein
MPYGGVGDACCHRGRVPVPDDERRADADRERALLLQVGDEGVEPQFRTLAVPVERPVPGKARYRTSATATNASPSNQPTLSAVQSGFTSAHSGIWRWLASGCSRRWSRCSSRVIPFTYGLVMGTTLLFGGGHRKPGFTMRVKTSLL